MKNVSKINQQTFNAGKTVKIYSSENILQKPEDVILNILKEKLSGKRMLDIGVGAGRTTRHFAPCVKEYVGIDYSSNMIQACRQKFSDRKIVFQVCDVRRMDIFSDHSFDFVLFSYNGIDYMDREDRFKAFNEIKRVLHPDGFFCFSSHNIQNIGRFLKLSLDPVRCVPVLRRFLRVRFLIQKFNGLERIPYALIRDGGEDFRVLTYYIKPIEQIKQLREMGFKHIRIFSEINGDGLEEAGLKDDKKNRWLYYFCF